MDINDIMNDITEDKKNQEYFNEPANGNPRFSRDKKKHVLSKILVLVGVILLVAVMTAGLIFFKKKPEKSLLTGPGGQVTILNRKPSVNSLVNSSTIPKQTAPDLKLNNISTGNKKQIIYKKPVIAGKNKLNDLFTVKYNNNKFNNSMNPIHAIPASFVPALPHFNVPDFKNMLKGGEGGKPVSLSVFAYSAGIVAASCGAGAVYLKMGETICGWTLLNANSEHAVFSQDKQIKRINY